MTKEEAIKEMLKGKKITHLAFMGDEWMTFNDDENIVFEDGVIISQAEFWDIRRGKSWDDGYSIFGTD